MPPVLRSGHLSVCVPFPSCAGVASGPPKLPRYRVAEAQAEERVGVRQAFEVRRIMNEEASEWRPLSEAVGSVLRQVREASEPLRRRQ